MAKKALFPNAYPRSYRALYRAYNFLNNEIFNPTRVVGILAPSIYVLYLYLRTQDLRITSGIAVLTYTALFVVRGVCWWLIDRICINIGSQTKFDFCGKYLIPGTNGEACRLDLGAVDTTKFRFAKTEDARSTAELNMAAYRRSAWATSVDDKEQRNGAHIQRNDQSILLIDCKATGSAVAFTHMFPVSERTWDRYKKGRIGDNTFPARLICPAQGHTEDNRPYGLILFSVAQAERNRDLEEEGVAYRKAVGACLEQAIAYHLTCYLAREFKDHEYVQVLFQNMSRTYLDFFKGCDVGGKEISYDGARIVTFEVHNTKTAPVTSIAASAQQL